jgi:hypothetical protein
MLGGCKQILPGAARFNLVGHNRVFLPPRAQTLNDGVLPPSDVTWDEWTQCDYDAWEATNRAAVYAARTISYDCTDLFAAPGMYLEGSMWSPRRGHVAVVADTSSIVVVGGRARDLSRMAPDRHVGGVTTAPVQNDKFHAAGREASVLKNDVWRSEDQGVTWALVNPGCRVPQRDLVLAGQPYVRTRVGGAQVRDWNNSVAAEAPGESVNQHLVQDMPRYGTLADACESDSDCWGDAICEALGRDKTCVCQLWSPREHHAAVSHQWSGDDASSLYVAGGYATVHQRNCGDFACGDSDAAGYRAYMNDVWKSQDGGVSWAVVHLHAPWAGRGGHSLIYFLGDIYLFNGQGGSTGQHPAGPVTYFAEQWRMDADEAWTNDLAEFTATENGTVPHWQARFGHSTVVESPNAANADTAKLFLLGGRDGDDFLSDCWSWRGPGYDWVKDYAEVTAQRYYLDKDSKVEMLVNVVPNNNKWGEDAIRRENFTTAADLRLLHGEGIFTVGDLAEADRRTLLKLRGYELPQVPEEVRLRWSDEKGGRDGVCYMQALAKALVSKCHDIDHTLSFVDSEKELPRHARPVFGTAGEGPPEGTGVISEWHGLAWGELEDGSYHHVTDEELIEGWDGCSDLGSESELLWPNIDVVSIGEVPQVGAPEPKGRWRYDVEQQAMEVTCKQTPLPRAFHTSVYFGEQVWVVGGKRDVDDHNNDLWYRDQIMPLSVLDTTPVSGTSDTVFKFSSNKDGSFFRYRVYWGDRLRALRPWSKAWVQESVGWLKNFNDVFESANTHTALGKQQDAEGGGNQGPGPGNYIFYLRAVDPAGNEDLLYTEGRNMHTWRYAPDPPAFLISFVFLGLFGTLCYVGYEYHKYQRALALERYAIKRIRRKFKGMMAEGGDRDAKSLSKKAKAKKGKTGKKKKVLKGGGWVDDVRVVCGWLAEVSFLSPLSPSL